MAIQDLLDIVGKQFAKKHPDSAVEFKTADKEEPPTGMLLDNPLLEFAFDRRFMAYGRFVLVYGKKGCAKTSLFYDFAKFFQANKGHVIWIETEHAIDLDYARKQGVDLSNMSIQHPETLEQGLEITEMLIRNLPKAFPDGDTPVLICYDSIAGSTVEYELDQSHTISDIQPGTHARLMGRFYRELVPILANEKCVVMMLNQLKGKIGGFGFSEDSQDALIGGEAQFFHSSYHFKMIKIGEDGETDGDVGTAVRKTMSKHKLQVKRNKLGREGKGQEIEFPLYEKGGIDWWTPLVVMLAKGYNSIVGKRGSYYVWNTPDTHYTDKDGVVQVIDTEQTYRDFELGGIIRSSPEAKEFIRTAFGIPQLPPPKVVEEVEEAKKKKRGRPAKEVDEKQPVKNINLV